MKLTSLSIITLLGLAVVPLTSSAEMSMTATSQESCQSLEGIWHNELESELWITQIDAATGKVEGWYCSPQGTAAELFELIGWVDVDKEKSNQLYQNIVKPIIFSVWFRQYGTMTSWSGYCTGDNAQSKITTLWHNVRRYSQFDFDHILANSDVFTPGEGSSHEICSIIHARKK